MLNPDGTKQVPPKVEEVNGTWSVTKGGRTIEAYSLDNPHAAGYIIPYIGFVTDIWSPAPRIPPPNSATIALVKGIRKMGIQMDRIAGRPRRHRQFQRFGKDGSVNKNQARLGTLGGPLRAFPTLAPRWRALQV